MNACYQALTTLNLRCNQIGETGALYVSDGLRINKVTNIHSILQFCIWNFSLK
jgi:hypothetical protein